MTAVFADLVGSTAIAERLDPEDWSDIVGEAVERMSAVVTRYGGRVEQVLGDGILAFFGLPVAHEDDPQRAVRAGLELVEAVRRFSDDTEAVHGFRLAIRVGISTGRVVVRDFGASSSRTELTALGDPVNVAARMQAEARPESVLVTAETYAFVADATEARHVGPVTLKGKREPVDGYEIVRWTGGSGRRRGIEGLISPLVGRDRERDQLRAALPAVRAGRGRVAVILGEPGIGKSRLLAELRRAASTGEDPLAWHEVRCPSYGQGLPYQLVASLARSLLGLPPVELAGDVASSESRGHDAPRVDEPGLAHLLGLEVPPDAASEFERLGPVVRQARYVDALGRTIEHAASDAALALVCEDAHWADAASVELLVRLLPEIRAHRVLLVIAARRDRDVPGWRLVTAARDALGDALVEVSLQPLSADDSRALVANLLEIESLPEATREHILSRADGNPFFIEEIVRMLVDRGAIERRDDHWVASRPIEAREIPDTLHGLLLARIDRLPAESRDVLRVASVIGRRFPVSVLSEVLAER